MRIDSFGRWPSAALSVLLLGGCVSERVVLLPAPDGRQTAIVVRDSRGEIVLDQPFAGVERRGNEFKALKSSEVEVKAKFGAALAAQPARPRSFVLYFEGGSERLTADSAVELTVIKREVAERPASEVLVIGHTDTVGGAEANDNLSQKRATAVREILIAAGVPAQKIETAGRGERELLVMSADEVAEPRNRRVEISVR
jgi:outer membrane protein OmpA-like peptidoglycan-associated protein